MNLLAVMQMAIALAGAPATTPVSCTPNIPLNENGWAYWAPAPQILLAPTTCNGLWYLGADQGLRFVARRRAPFTNWDGEAGQAALVMLHESSHIAGLHDETDAECNAMRLLPDFLSRYLTGTDYERALETARNYDAFLPPMYHERTC